MSVRGGQRPPLLSIPSTKCDSGSCVGSLCTRCWRIIFTDLRVALRNPILIAWSSPLLPCLDVGLRRLCLHQRRLLLLREVLHLQSQQCERSNRLQSLFPLPLEQMNLFQLVSVFPDVTDTTQGVTLLDVTE